MPGLASKRDLLNAEKFIATDDHRTIITFHLQLLEYACRTGMISKATKESIHKNTLAYLSQEFPASTLKQQNMLYCMDCFLKTQKNSDALDYLLKIKSIADVSQWFNDTSTWINKQKMIMISKLRKVQKYLTSQTREAYNALMEQINNVYSWSTGLSFAALHHQVIATDSLILSDVPFHSETYFEKLMNTIKAFGIEISIMSKINASEVLKMNTTSEKNEHDKIVNRLIELDSEFDYEAEKIQKAYQQSLRRMEKAQVKFDLFTAKMSDEEFDIFIESDHPIAKEFAKFDEVAIQTSYEKKMRTLKEKIDRKKKALNNLKEVTRSNIVTSDIICLSLMIKEYALFVLASAGKVEYPETLDEKDTALESIDMSTAVDCIIKDAEKFQLTEEEISYLRQLM